MKQGKTQHIGALGEEIARRYLVKRGFSILDQNYRKKWGEIDIVTKKGAEVVFVEVKSVSRACDRLSDYRPEENVHPQKIKRLSRAIESYLLERNLNEVSWRLDVVAVFLESGSKQAQVRRVKNVL